MPATPSRVGFITSEYRIVTAGPNTTAEPTAEFVFNAAVAAFLSRISGSAQSGLFRPNDASIAGNNLTWLDMNGGTSIIQGDASFHPVIETDRVRFPDTSTLVTARTEAEAAVAS